MIKVQDLSYSYPQKDLYDRISFTIEDDVHCALIGTNGTGKSTLLDLMMHSGEYLYDGKIEMDGVGRIGYVSQFSQLDTKEDVTVFQYISETFVMLEQRIIDYCKEMESGNDLERLFREYQDVMDAFNAVDGDHYESNIKKQLKAAGLQKLEEQKITSLSGGEFKLVQVIREMMRSPRLLLMDEPDVFLDFKHQNALRNLISAHKGTLLVITHNRYLLNHCFDKILHLENKDIQEFEGSFLEYNYVLLSEKIDLQEAAAADEEEIERQSKILAKARVRATVMDNASLGKAVHARQSLVDRLKTRKTKAPFVEIRQPDISFGMEEPPEDGTVLTLKDYSVSFDEQLLEHVDFEIKSGEHAAIVGNNGTGKTTLLRDIFEQDKDTVIVGEHVKISMFSQITGSFYDSDKALLEILEEKGIASTKQAADLLKKYGLDGKTPDQKVSALSGGEKDLFQFAVLSLEKSDFLLLDEPTGHLDLYGQIALERAVSEYKGTVLMVSHDFYTVSGCADYVLLAENNTVRRMSVRRFRKMIYADYFDKDYLLLEQKKKETETRIQQLLRSNEFEKARALLEPLEEIIKSMKTNRN